MGIIEHGGKIQKHFITYQSSEQHNISRYDAAMWYPSIHKLWGNITFVLKKSFVGIHRLCCQALPLYHRSTANMSSLIIRHFQFLFKSPKTHVTFEQNVTFRTLVIYKRTKCKVYISEIRGVKTTKTLKTWWRDVNNVTWVFGLSRFNVMRVSAVSELESFDIDMPKSSIFRTLNFSFRLNK